VASLKSPNERPSAHFRSETEIYRNDDNDDNDSSDEINGEYVK